MHKEDILKGSVKNFINKKINVYGHYSRAYDVDAEGIEPLFVNNQFRAEFFEFMSLFAQGNDNFSNKNVLDLGCSCGPLAFTFADQFRHIVGVDLEEDAISVANLYKQYKGIANIDFIVDDAIGMTNIASNYSGYFDIVFLKDIVEHLGSLQNFEMLLKNLKYVLKKDALIVVEAPNYLFPFEPHLSILIPPKSSKGIVKFFGKLAGRLKTDDETVFVDWLNLLSAFELEKAFMESGYEIVANITEEWKLKRYFLENTNYPRGLYFWAVCLKY